MAIERVAIIGRGAVGLLYGSLIEKSLGPGVVEFVMDDERFARHAGETVTVNGEPCRVPTVPASKATPVDLVILAIKAPGALAGSAPSSPWRRAWTPSSSAPT